MPQFSFTEKEWDKLRPSSVKETGVSAAMRAVLKSVPKDLKSLDKPGEVDAAEGLLETLDAALKKADGLVKPKDDKNGAAAKALRAWTAEVADARKMLVLHKSKLLLAGAAQAAKVKMDELKDRVEAEVRKAVQTARDIKAMFEAGDTGQNLTQLSNRVMGHQAVLRDAAKFTTKSGFVDFIRHEDAVHRTGVDPADVPLPDSTAAVKQLVGGLEKACDAAKDQLDKLHELVSAPPQKGNFLDSPFKKLVAAAKAIDDKLKGQASVGRHLSDQAKQVADLVKNSTDGDTSRLLDALHKVHLKAVQYEHDTIGVSYSIRDSRGDLAKASAKLKQSPLWTEEHGKQMADWNSVIFTSLRPCTIASAALNQQIDRALKHLEAIGGATAQQAASMEAHIKEDRKDLAAQYSYAGH